MSTQEVPTPKAPRRKATSRQTRAWNELVRAVEECRSWMAERSACGLEVHRSWAKAMLMPYLAEYSAALAAGLAWQGHDRDLLDSELAAAADAVLETVELDRETSQVLAHIANRVRGAVLDAGRAQRRSVSGMGRNVARYQREFSAAVARARLDGRPLSEADLDRICERVVPEEALPTTRLAVRYGGPPEHVVPQWFGVPGGGEDEGLDEAALSRLHRALLDFPDAALRQALVEHAEDEAPLPKWADLQERLARLGQALGPALAEQGRG